MKYDPVSHDLPLLRGEELIAIRCRRNNRPGIKFELVEDAIPNRLVQNFGTYLRTVRRDRCQSTSKFYLERLVTGELPTQLGPAIDRAEQELLELKRANEKVGVEKGNLYFHLRKELQALEERFPVLEFNDNTIAVTTDYITLSDDESIDEAKIGRLIIRLVSFNQFVIAPQGNDEPEGYFHPHVNKRGEPCYGNAHRPIRNALENGEIFEAFCMMDAHLKYYNSGEGYYEISGLRCDYCDDQTGVLVHCSDCGCSICEDCRITCECGTHLCHDCGYYCDICEEPLCPEHALECSKCGDVHCETCMTEDDLCSYCHNLLEEEKRAEEEKEREEAA